MMATCRSTTGSVRSVVALVLWIGFVVLPLAVKYVTILWLGSSKKRA